MWDCMTRQVASHPDVTVVDEEPTRQIHYGTNYVVRFKRHASNLRIETFPTGGALAFWTNQGALPGLELVTLAMGYIWDTDLGEIGDASMSFRDGKNKPVWSVTVKSRGGEAATDITWEPIDPQLPQTGPQRGCRRARRGPPRTNHEPDRRRHPVRKSGDTSRISDIHSTVASSGFARSFSYRDSAAWVIPSWSASSSCVRPAARRAVRPIPSNCEEH
jgi:hypothetical protein